MWFSKKLREGDVYACRAGDHIGKLLVYIESNIDSHGFIAIPSMANLWVPKEKFDFGIQNSIIEFVERSPKYVRKTSKVKFRENKEEFRLTE